MKDIKTYISEAIELKNNNDIQAPQNSIESEELQSEVSLALKDFGSIRNGFKQANKNDIIDAMYKLGFDYSEEDSKEFTMAFVGDYINNKYLIDLYIDKQHGDDITLKSFNIFEYK